MAVTHIASSAATTANPTTTCAITVDSAVVIGHDLFVSVTSRDHTAVTAYVTVTDNDTNGLAWTRIASSTDRVATLWWKRATRHTASTTVTVAGAVGSCSAGIAAYAGANLATPYADITVQDNASGTESHTGFTPTAANSMVCLSVSNYGNDNAVTSPATTTPGALNARFEQLSTGGNDCACMHASAPQSGGPSTTGNFTWAQTDGVTKSIVWSIPPLITTSPPTLALKTESVWNTSVDKTTASLSVETGDVIVAVAVVANSVDTLTATNTGGAGMPFTQQQFVNVAGYCPVYAWTAVADGTKSITVTADAAANTVTFGCAVYVFNNASAVGASNKANASGAAPSMSLTPQQAYSAVVLVNGDWNSVDGVSRVWREADAGVLTESTYFRNAGSMTVYVGYHADAGVVAAKTLGLSAPGGQKYGLIAVEIKGIVPPTGPPAGSLALLGVGR